MSDLHFQSVINLSIKNPENLADARERFRGELMSMGIDREDMFDITSTVFEIVTNAKRHGGDDEVAIGFINHTEEIEIGIKATSHKEHEALLRCLILGSNQCCSHYVDVQGGMGIDVFVASTRDPAITDGWIHGKFQNPAIAKIATR